jgi:hypothetical protein
MVQSEGVHSNIVLEFVFDKLRQARTSFRFDLDENGLELFLRRASRAFDNTLTI